MRLRHCVIVAIVVVLALLTLLMLQKTSDRYYYVHRSIYNAKTLIHSCLTYRDHPQSGGKYPASLDELIKPPFGGTPLLEDPQHDVLDGWGKRLRYAVVVNEQGEPEPYVWAERVVNGKIFLCGAKGMSNGTVVAFGLPE
jgi:hypothetical protein